jgi:hypothetical protein
VAGLLAGHGLSYLVAVPDPNHRDLLLERTGHAYLPAAGRVSLVLILAAVASLAGRALLSRRPEPTPSFATLAVRLSAVQVAAFAGQEVLERVLSGAALHGLVGSHILLVGIATQVLVAFVGATLLRWLTRAASTLAQTPGPVGLLPRPATVLVPPAAAGLGLAAVVRTPHGPRAPPSV